MRAPPLVGAPKAHQSLARGGGSVCQCPPSALAPPGAGLACPDGWSPIRPGIKEGWELGPCPPSSGRWSGSLSRMVGLRSDPFQEDEVRSQSESQKGTLSMTPRGARPVPVYQLPCTCPPSGRRWSGCSDGWSPIQSALVEPQLHIAQFHNLNHKEAAPII